MSTVRRYSAGEMRSMAEYFSGNGTDATVRAMLNQAVETEARVMGLVEALEQIEKYANRHHSTLFMGDMAREALSKFRGEDA